MVSKATFLGSYVTRVLHTAVSIAPCITVINEEMINVKDENIKNMNAIGSVFLLAFLFLKKCFKNKVLKKVVLYNKNIL